MADRSSDVLMYIKLTKSMVPAEATSKVEDDDLTSDFTPGNFFELRSFSFGVKLHDENKSKTQDKHSGGNTSKGGSATHGSSGEQEQIKMPFSAFYNKDSLETVPVELSEISFERNLDRGSATLWNFFMSKEVIPSAAVVRRKNIGGTQPKGYLRFTFKDLLVTDIDWEESDVLVIEKCKMICRSAQVIYKLQSFDNSLGDASGPGWGYLTPQGF